MVATTLEWRRSSYCADRACVEVARIGNTVALRDSKDVDREPLILSEQDFAGFCAWLAGETL